jgi:hypothetical protein
MDREIADLLHDAQLERVALQGTSLTLHVRGLRHGTDGAPLADPVVELRFLGVRAIAASYDGSFGEQRPSMLAITRGLTLDDLRAWPFEQRDIEAIPEGRASIDDALSGARVDWLAGDEPACLASPHHLVLHLCSPLPGMPGIKVVLLAGYASLDALSGGVPLSRDRWRAEFDAWWVSWRRYWERRREEPGEEDGDAAFEAAIPAAPNEARPEYQPPNEPPFALLPTDAPEALLAPVRDWFEGTLRGDFLRAAGAYPGIAESIEARAEQLRDDTYRTFGYARAVDNWWMEGRRACVVVRGIEHLPPDGEDDAEDRESVWTFSLRPSGERWVIRTYAQC